MPSITFEPISADYSFHTDGQDNGSSHRRLLFRVRLPEWDALELTSGDKFGTVDAIVEVVPKGLPSEHSPDSFGTLSFVRSDARRASLTVWISMSNDQFEDLVSTAKLGRIPSEIRIYVAGVFGEYGMEYLPGYGQGGPSGKKWDNVAHPHVPLESVAFKVPLVTNYDPEFKEQFYHQDTTPPTWGQINRLLQALDRQEKSLIEFKNIVLYASIALGVLLIWTKW